MTVVKDERWKPVDLGNRISLRYLGRSAVLQLVSLFDELLLDFGPALLIFLMRGACCGLFDVDCIGSIPFEGNCGVQWVGWKLGVREALGQGLELADSLGRLNDPATPTASFAEFCRDFEEVIVANRNGELLPDVSGSRCNILRGG